MKDEKTNLDKEEWEPVPGYEWLLEVERWEGDQA